MLPTVFVKQNAQKRTNPIVLLHKCEENSFMWVYVFGPQTSIQAE